MENKIITTLVACVLISAVGGFGAPFFCRGDGKCADNWRAAAAGSLAAAGTLGTLLANLGNHDGP